ncbi:hypothetical protein [Candidatus Pantoea formicae]
MKTTNMVPSGQLNPCDEWLMTTQTNGDDCRESGMEQTNNGSAS